MSLTSTSSRAKSRDPGGLLIGFATGFFDSLRFAQNDRAL
jgi:hypothetical protein